MVPGVTIAEKSLQVAIRNIARLQCANPAPRSSDIADDLAFSINGLSQCLRSEKRLAKFR